MSLNLLEFTLVPILIDGFFMARQNKNLMPMKQVDGVAPKTLVSNITLSRFQGVQRRLLISLKLISAAYVVVYLLGYQPVIGFPPIQKALVHGQSTDSAEQQPEKATIEKASFSQPFQLPHPGYLSTPFSSWHPGVDIADGFGAPIHPIADGKVVETTYGFWGLGHYVVVEHEQGIRSTYGHMGRVFTAVGEVVNQSSIIGEIGMTGNTSGPHTHLEITKDGRYIDPLTVLPVLSTIPAPEFLGVASGSALLAQNFAYYSEPEIVEKPVEEKKLNLKKEIKFSL